eukprot:9486213-Pyramimonas_sp.AAC.1
MSCGKQVKLYDSSRPRDSSVDMRVFFDSDVELIGDSTRDQGPKGQGMRTRSPGRGKGPENQVNNHLDGLLAKAI